MILCLRRHAAGGAESALSCCASRWASQSPSRRNGLRILWTGIAGKPVVRQPRPRLPMPRQPVRLSHRMEVRFFSASARADAAAATSASSAAPVNCAGAAVVAVAAAATSAACSVTTAVPSAGATLCTGGGAGGNSIASGKKLPSAGCHRRRRYPHLEDLQAPHPPRQTGFPLGGGLLCGGSLRSRCDNVSENGDSGCSADPAAFPAAAPARPCTRTLKALRQGESLPPD